MPARSAYLETARVLADDLDDRRRASFLFNLAISYQESGDVEAAIRIGQQGLALYRAAGAPFESATIENDLAMAYLATGNLERATELAERGPQRSSRKRAMTDSSPPSWTRRPRSRSPGGSTIGPSGWPRAPTSWPATRATEPSRSPRSSPRPGSPVRGGTAPTPRSAMRPLPTLAREGSAHGRLRDLLGEWADLRAESGDYQGAYELTSEAVKVN